jgi:hypothetical protein
MIALMPLWHDRNGRVCQAVRLYDHNVYGKTVTTNERLRGSGCLHLPLSGGCQCLRARVAEWLPRFVGVKDDFTAVKADKITAYISKIVEIQQNLQVEYTRIGIMCPAGYRGSRSTCLTGLLHQGHSSGAA